MAETNCVWESQDIAQTLNLKKHVPEFLVFRVVRHLVSYYFTSFLQLCKMYLYTVFG